MLDFRQDTRSLVIFKVLCYMRHACMIISKLVLNCFGVRQPTRFHVSTFPDALHHLRYLVRFIERLRFLESLER